MKKILFVLAAVLAMPLGSAALAADYSSNDNSVTAEDISAYSTVLISNDTTKDIVYLNQASDVFSTSMSFMLKDGAVDGEYTMLLGNSSGTNKTVTFTIGEQQSETTEPVVMDALEGSESYAEGYKNLAFVKESVKLGDYNAIKVVINKGTENEAVGGFKLADVLGTKITGGSEVNFGLQINNVPDEVTSIEVSLCNVEAFGMESAW